MEYKQIKKFGKSAKGKMYLLKYLDGVTPTLRGGVLAKCYECTNGYADGKIDCGITSCPLYPFMPYRKGEKVVLRKKAGQQQQ